MRKALAFLPLLGLLLAACEPVGIAASPSPVVVPSETLSPVVVTPSLLGTPIQANNEGLLCPGSPAYIELSGNGVRSGALLDTWTTDGYVDIGQARVEYRAGDKLCIFVYNGYDSPIKFRVWYEDIVGESVFSQSTNRTYARAPVAAKSWVKIGELAAPIQAKSVYALPVSIQIPKDLASDVLPEAWQFRLHVQPVGVGTFVGDASVQFLITR